MDAARKQYLLVLALETQTSPIEGALCYAFVDKHADDYEDFYFQKRVGEGVTLIDPDTGQLDKVWYQATRKRVDLVGYTPAGATLVEFKNNATRAALVQVQNYAIEWITAPTKPAVVALIVVARTAEPGFEVAARNMGIGFELFPEVPVWPPTRTPGERNV